MGLFYSQNNVINIENNINQPQIIHNLNNENQYVLNQNQSIISKEEKILPITSNNISKKTFNHNFIENILKISLSPEVETGILYLELYHAQLLSDEKEEIFDLDDADNIILEIINGSDRVKF